MAEKKRETPDNLVPQVADAERERLKRDIYRPDMEKLQLFTQMLRRNALFRKAKVSHK